MKVIIIGSGKALFLLTQAVLSKGHEASVITSKPEEQDALAKRFKVGAIAGDGTDPTILESAGAKNADLLIAATSSDYINLSCCQIALNYFQIPHTVTMVNDPDNYEIFKKLEIEHVFNKTDIIVSMLEKSVESLYVSPLLEYNDGNVLFNEIMLTEEMPGTGVEIGKLDMPENAQIVGVNREGKFIVTDDRFVLQAGDRIMLACFRDALGHAIRTLCGSAA